MSYTEDEKKKYVEKYRKGKKSFYDFSQANGILISDLKQWIREYPQIPNNFEGEFGIINLDEKDDIKETPTLKGFKFENDTIKIELQDNYDKSLIRTLMGVLVK